MGDLVEQLGRLVGVSDETASLVIAIVALLLIVFGSVVLLVTLFDKWAHTIEQDTSSRLLPTLVEDMLDVDLQRVYRRTLMLDDQIARSFDALTEPTGTELGRKARQIVVRMQAERFAARRESARQETDEPPEQEARLREVSVVVDEALDRLPIDRLSATDSAATNQAAQVLVAEKLEELSSRLQAPDSKRPRNTPAG